MPTELSAAAGAQARWLAMRQEAVALNVANSAQPGFRAREAPSFATVLGALDGAGTGVDPARAILPSRNTVDVAAQMIEGSEVGRAHRINAAVTGAFHRMALMVAQ